MQIFYHSIMTCQQESLQKILVIHVGAGSFAISVCHLSGSEVKVKYSDGCLLGGEAFYYKCWFENIPRGIINQVLDYKRRLRVF